MIHFWPLIMTCRNSIGCITSCLGSRLLDSFATCAVDVEALFGAFKEKYFPASGLMIDKERLKELFVSLNYDKLPEAAPPAEEADENEEEKKDEAPAPAPVPAAMTDYGGQTYELVAQHLQASGDSVHAAQLLSTLLICKAGYGETAFRFALKAVATDESGSLKESPLWMAITTSTNRPFDTPIIRNHIRRAFRTAEKLQPPAPEAADGEEAPPPPVVAPIDTAILIDDFVAKVSEDPLLAEALMKEVAVPIEAPPEAEGEAAE